MISLPPLDARRYTLNAKRGFTLIELLVVIGILTVLFAIVLIAVNPGRQFAQANNTQRRSDVNAILNAVHQYAASNKGNLTPLGLDTTERELCRPVVSCATSPLTDAVDICTQLVSLYLAAMPTDPQTTVSFTNCTSDYSTKYSIQSTTNNRITVKALTPEINETISVTR